MEVLTTLEKKSIISLWWKWYFYHVPFQILRGWKNFLKFGLNYFSLVLLLKTYFSHWRNYRWFYPRGLDIPKIIEAWVSNFISRMLGAFIRTFIIIFGIIFEIMVLIMGSVLLFSWIFLPFILIVIFIYGWRLLF